MEHVCSRFVHWLLPLIVLVAGCLGEVGGGLGSGERIPMMSGGTPAVPGQFPATVYIPDCTASKVGATFFLTAAHCVVDAPAMTIEPGFAAGAELAIYTGVNLGEERARHLLTVRRTSIHPSYAARLCASDGEGVDKQDFNQVFDLALIEVLEPTDAIAVATLDHSFQQAGSAIVVGGYGLKVDPTPIDDGSGGIIVAGEDDPNAGPTNRLDAAATTIDATDGTVHLVLNGYTLDGIGHVLSGGLFADKALKLLPGDSGGAVYLDDRPPDVELAGHRFSTVVGVNSFTGLAHSAFSRIDDLGPGGCLRHALAGGEEQELGCVPLLCAP
jgi:hypothetical protein